jgi:hypothetical protein
MLKRMYRSSLFGFWITTNDPLADCSDRVTFPLFALIGAVKGARTWAGGWHWCHRLGRCSDKSHRAIRRRAASSESSVLRYLLGQSPVIFATWRAVGGNRHLLLLLSITGLLAAGQLVVIAFVGPLLTEPTGATPRGLGNPTSSARKLTAESMLTRP